MKFPAIPILLGISLAGGAALGMLYMLFKEDDIDYNPRSITGTKSSRPVTVQVKIPKDVVGIVIGRQGSNIKEIQEQTKTKINFKDENDAEDYRMCSITGSTEGTSFAESLIQKIIRNQPVISTCEIKVPMRALGRIIGRNGENVRSITQLSGARVTIDNEGNPRDKFADRSVLLKGTVEQMAVAKTLINEKVNEDAILREKYESGAANRTPRREFKPPVNLHSNIEKEELPVDVSQHKQRLIATSGADMMEVYVSAVVSPGRFWVQSVSPSSVELDQLLVQMTDHYSKQVNQDIHFIKNLSVGQFVAAPFLSDEKWYRAQVVSVEGEMDAPESQVELYYVDYGDSQIALRQEVLELRPNFLRLKFQAIECTLAKVKPAGESWTHEAADVFEELTHNAKWKPIMCNIEAYEQHELRTREDSPAPAVSLFDLNGTKDVNVAEELVRYGHAVYADPQKAAEFSARHSVGSSSGSAGNIGDSSHSAADTTASTLSLNTSLSGRSSELSINASETGLGPKSPSRMAANFPTKQDPGLASQAFIASQNGSGDSKHIDHNAMFKKVSPDFDDDMELF